MCQQMGFQEVAVGRIQTLGAYEAAGYIISESRVNEL